MLFALLGWSGTAPVISLWYGCMLLAHYTRRSFWHLFLDLHGLQLALSVWFVNDFVWMHCHHVSQTLCSTSLLYKAGTCILGACSMLLAFRACCLSWEKERLHHNIKQPLLNLWLQLKHSFIKLTLNLLLHFMGGGAQRATEKIIYSICSPIHPTLCIALWEWRPLLHN